MELSLCVESSSPPLTPFALLFFTKQRSLWRSDLGTSSRSSYQLRETRVLAPFHAGLSHLPIVSLPSDARAHHVPPSLPPPSSLSCPSPSPTPASRPPLYTQCYFLSAASAATPLIFLVTPLRRGRSYQVLSVEVRQNGSPVFSLACSFQLPEPRQPSFQIPFPSNVPAPENCEMREDKWQAVIEKEEAKWKESTRKHLQMVIDVSTMFYFFGLNDQLASRGLLLTLSRSGATRLAYRDHGRGHSWIAPKPRSLLAQGSRDSTRRTFGSFTEGSHSLFVPTPSILVVRNRSLSSTFSVAILRRVSNSRLTLPSFFRLLFRFLQSLRPS